MIELKAMPEFSENTTQELLEIDSINHVSGVYWAIQWIQDLLSERAKLHDIDKVLMGRSEGYFKSYKKGIAGS